MRGFVFLCWRTFSLVRAGFFLLPLKVAGLLYRHLGMVLDNRLGLGMTGLLEWMGKGMGKGGWGICGSMYMIERELRLRWKGRGRGG
jgi:hypothetical protein